MAASLIFLVAGCTAVLDASSYGLSQPYANRVVTGGLFEHRVVLKEGAGTSLHVYIDGDGRAWETRITRAEDPTPDRALALELMALDDRPALYLGRPCYFVRQGRHCDDNRWWTSHRYSREVVDSLNGALDRFAGSYDSVTLIGHSGGGTLAYLMAAERSDVVAIVTLAANLNVPLWTRLHRYAPLFGSLNPGAMPALPARIRQYHFLGRADGNVSPEVVTSVLSGQETAHFELLPGIDHACCWQQLWPALLADVLGWQAAGGMGG